MDTPQDNPNAEQSPVTPRPMGYLQKQRPSASGPRVSIPHRNEPSGNTLTPGFLWWTLRQWWMYVLPVGILLAATAATAVVLTYKPDYRAAALVMIESSAPYIAFSNEANSAGTQRYVETQIELLRSELVLGPVLSREDIGKMTEIATTQDRLVHLQRHLSIAPVGQSELYNVSYECKSPADAAAVANAVIEEYLTIQSQDDFGRFTRVIDLLEEERKKRSLDVEKLRQRVTDLSKAITGRDAFGYNSTLDVAQVGSPLDSTYHELTRIEVERAVLEAEIRSLQESSGGSEQDEKSGLLDLQMNSHPTVAASQAAIDAAVMRAEEYKSHLKKDLDPQEDAKYQQIQRDVEQQKKTLKDYQMKLREVLVAERQEEQRGRHAESLEKLKRDLSLLDTRRTVLGEKLKKEMEGVSSENTKTIDLEFARAELEREEKVFEMIAARKLAMQTESRAPARVALRQKASPPMNPVSPLPYKILFLACAAALAAPFGLAVAREMTVRRISDVEQVSREMMVQVLGEVSHFPIRRVAANVQLLPSKLRRQMFLYLDSIDSLRTNIALSEHGKAAQLFVVTSAAAGEGKTCLATSLAMSMARADKRPTLVIDADLRSPDVATVLSLRAKPGLAELLRNEASIPDVVQRVGTTSAYVIAAGRLKGNPHHAIQEATMRPILEQLRKKFATIIIDTPPVFGGSESLVLARMADATIISLLRDVSRSRQLEAVIKRLEHAGANVLGVALNGKPAFSYANFYGYGSYSGRLESLEA